MVRNLAHKNNENSVAVRGAGGVPVLVSLLQTCAAKHCKERVAEALTNLAQNRLTSAAIVKAGALGGLLLLLNNGTPGEKETAASVLLNLSGSGLHDYIASPRHKSLAGVVRPLVDLLQHGRPGGKETAAKVWHNMALSTDINDGVFAMCGTGWRLKQTPGCDIVTKMNSVFRDNGGTAPLLDLLRHGNAGGKKMAALVLKNMLKRKDGWAARDIKHVAAALVTRLRDTNSRNIKEHAIVTLSSLAWSDANKAIIREAGGLAALTKLASQENQYQIHRVQEILEETLQQLKPAGYFDYIGAGCDYVSQTLCLPLFLSYIGAGPLTRHIQGLLDGYSAGTLYIDTYHFALTFLFLCFITLWYFHSVSGIDTNNYGQLTITVLILGCVAWRNLIHYTPSVYGYCIVFLFSTMCLAFSGCLTCDCLRDEHGRHYYGKGNPIYDREMKRKEQKVQNERLAKERRDAKESQRLAGKADQKAEQRAAQKSAQKVAQQAAQKAAQERAEEERCATAEAAAAAAVKAATEAKHAVAPDAADKHAKTVEASLDPECVARDAEKAAEKQRRKEERDAKAAEAEAKRQRADEKRRLQTEADEAAKAAAKEADKQRLKERRVEKAAQAAAEKAERRRAKQAQLEAEQERVDRLAATHAEQQNTERERAAAEEAQAERAAAKMAAKLEKMRLQTEKFKVETAKLKEQHMKEARATAKALEIEKQWRIEEEAVETKKRLLAAEAEWAILRVEQKRVEAAETSAALKEKKKSGGPQRCNLCGSHVKDLEQHATRCKGWQEESRAVRACTFGLKCTRDGCWFAHPAGHAEQLARVKTKKNTRSRDKTRKHEMDAEYTRKVTKGSWMMALEKEQQMKEMVALEAALEASVKMATELKMATDLRTELEDKMVDDAMMEAIKEQGAKVAALKMDRDAALLRLKADAEIDTAGGKGEKQKETTTNQIKAKMQKEGNQDGAFGGGGGVGGGGRSEYEADQAAKDELSARLFGTPTSAATPPPPLPPFSSPLSPPQSWGDVMDDAGWAGTASPPQVRLAFTAPTPVNTPAHAPVNMETEALRARLECVVCFAEERSTMFAPCMHLCVCMGCAAAIMRWPPPLCPMCRDPVTAVRQVHIC